MFSIFYNGVEDGHAVATHIEHHRGILSQVLVDMAESLQRVLAVMRVSRFYYEVDWDSQRLRQIGDPDRSDILLDARPSNDPLWLSPACPRSRRANSSRIPCR